MHARDLRIDADYRLKIAPPAPSPSVVCAAQILNNLSEVGNRV